jgi:hypothetical protein
MKIDKIEIVSEFKHLQVRILKPLFDENGIEVSSSFERKILFCGDFVGAKEHGAEIESLANVLWTQELVLKYKETQKEEEPIVQIQETERASSTTIRC